MLKKHGAVKPVSVGKMLETYGTSNFKNKIILCYMIPRAINSELPLQDKISKIRHHEHYPVFFQEHSDYLDSLLTDNNITLIDMRKTRIKRAHKIMDYMIVVKEANSAQ